jgi:tetratricopeptide (TPR) repeat protein
MLARAYLAQGRLQQAQGATSDAVKSYRRARQLGHGGAAVPLAPLLAAAAQSDDTAVDVYLEYLRSQAVPAEDARSQLVLRALEGACRIADGDPSARIATNLRRLDTVVAAVPSAAWAHRYAGIGRMLQEDWSAARAALERARQLDPRCAATYYYLGRAYLQAGQPTLAEADLLDALRLDPKQADAAFLLGKLKLDAVLQQPYLAEKGWYSPLGHLRSDSDDALVDDAAGWLREATSLDDRKPDHFYWLGIAHLVRRRCDPAIKALQQAADLNRRSKESLFYLGVAHRFASPETQAHRKKAREALECALALDQGYGAAHSVLAGLCFEEQAYQEAAGHYRTVLAQSSADTDARLALGRCYFELGRYEDAVAELRQIGPGTEQALFWLGRAQLKRRLYSEAVGSFESLHAGFRPTADSLYHLGTAHAGAGMAADAERPDASGGAPRHLDTALQSFEGCLAQQADYWQAHLQMGHIYVHRDDLSPAEHHYLQAQVHQPNKPAVLTALGRVASMRGDWSQARSHFERALQADPRHAPALLGLGVAAERSGDSSAAVVAYHKAEALTHLGALHCKLGDYRQAVDYLTKAATGGSPDGEDAQDYYLGYALAQTGQHAEALRVWGRLGQRHPDDTDLALNTTRLYYRMGAAHAKAGQYAEAAGAWEKYLEGYPQDEQMATELAQVYLALALSLRGDTRPGDDTARRAFQRAVELSRGEGRYVYPLALDELREQAYADSEAQLRTLLAEEPGRAAYSYHLALALLGQDRLAEAQEVLKQAIEGALPASTAPLAALASAALHARAGRWAEAADVVRSWASQDGPGGLP